MLIIHAVFGDMIRVRMYIGSLLNPTVYLQRIPLGWILSRQQKWGYLMFSGSRLLIVAK